MGRIISTTLWLTDIDGVRLADLSDSLIAGTIEMNTDRDAGKLAATFTIKSPTGIEPYRRYFAPTLTIEYDDGRATIEKPLGFYMVRTPTADRTIERNEATYQCEDLSRLLSYSAYTAVDNVPASTGVLTEVAATIAEAGIGKYSFPSNATTTTKALTYPIGTTRLEKANDLLSSIGWYALYPRLDGRLTSKPYIDLSRAEPVAVLTDADILGPISTQTNDQTVVNVVVVVRDDPALAPLYAVARNDDPSSPTSTTAIGFEYTRVERVTEQQTQTEVDAYAARLLREARTFYQTATLSTWPDVDFGIHEVVRLATTGEAADLQGLWWVRQWSLGLTPADCVYSIELNRVTTSAGVAV